MVGEEVYLVVSEDPYDAESVPDPLVAFRRREDADAYRRERFAATFNRTDPDGPLGLGRRVSMLDAYFPIQPLELR